MVCGGCASSSDARQQSTPDQAARPQLPADVTVAEFVAGSNRLVFDLFARLRPGPANRLFSPSRISTPTAVTYAEADGMTEAEMAQTMRLPSLPGRYTCCSLRHPEVELQAHQNCVGRKNVRRLISEPFAESETPEYLRSVHGLEFTAGSCDPWGRRQYERKLGVPPAWKQAYLDFLDSRYIPEIYTGAQFCSLNNELPERIR